MDAYKLNPTNLPGTSQNTDAGSHQHSAPHQHSNPTMMTQIDTVRNAMDASLRLAREVNMLRHQLVGGADESIPGAPTNAAQIQPPVFNDLADCATHLRNEVEQALKDIERIREAL